VPGCATGEEAYSIAILIREQMNALGQEWETQIFATDIDDQAIEKSSTGTFPDNIAADVTAERLQKFFVTDGKTYQISKSIREMVVFAVQSIIKDPPFSNVDLISCRNVLIYLEPALQKKIIPMFHYALKRAAFCCWAQRKPWESFTASSMPSITKAGCFDGEGMRPSHNGCRTSLRHCQ